MEKIYLWKEYILLKEGFFMLQQLKNLSKETKLEYIIVAIIFIISIIVGIIVGKNEEWFRPSFFMAGYMGASVITCLLLFTLYRVIEIARNAFKK